MIKHLKGLEINTIYDFDNAFSINELLCKFWEKIEETINISNECIDILNWVKEQGLSDEVEKLITQLVDDGTIEQMINIDKIEELRTLINTNREQLEQNKTEFINKIEELRTLTNTHSEQMEENKKEVINKINDLNNNKRIFKAVFGHCVDWSFKDGNGSNWGEEKIKTEIDNLKRFGVEELSITIQTKCQNKIVSLVSDLELFKKCLDYAKEKGLKTSMIKIHCNEFRESLNNTLDKTSLFNQWYSLVTNVSNYFKGYCEYFVPINEGEIIFKENAYEDFLNGCLTIGKNAGFKCGFAPSSAIQWDLLPETVRNSCDFISFNCYPSVSLKGLKTTYEDVINAFEDYQLNQWINSHKEKYNKEIIITEIGIEDRASCFANTYVWDFGNGEPYNNGQVQNIMLKGIFESLKDNTNLNKLYYWFPFRGNKVIESINYYVGGATNE